MYLAQKGIVHRDLSLRNLLVDKKTLQVKVSDLGLGRSNNVKNDQLMMPIRYGFTNVE
jgi:serine/threonine protein kinase